MEEPKILKMKVWCIEDRPIFYGYEDEDSVYSIIDKTITEKPGFIDAMTVRDLEPTDLSDVILHDQLSTDDFECLKGANMIPEELQALFQKVQDLRLQLDHLQSAPSSQEVEKTQEEELSKAAVDTVVAMVKNQLLGSDGSVFDQIVAGTTGLSEQEQKVINLVKEHLMGSNFT